MCKMESSCRGGKQVWSLQIIGKFPFVWVPHLVKTNMITQWKTFIKMIFHFIGWKWKNYSWKCQIGTVCCQNFLGMDMSLEFVLEQKNTMKHLSVLSNGNMGLSIDTHHRIQFQWKIMMSKQQACKWQTIWFQIQKHSLSTVPKQMPKWILTS